jgi:hypothetical protein
LSYVAQTRSPGRSLIFMPPPPFFFEGILILPLFSHAELLAAFNAPIA